jgi:phage protein D
MADSSSKPVRSAAWQLQYLGKNITEDVIGMVTDIVYTSKCDGASSDLDIKIEDSQKLWQGPWYPAKDDILSLFIGYSDQQLVSCGSFQVDEIELEGPPDVFHLKCLTSYITPSLRTPNTAPYENQTLEQIATTVAKRHGLTVVGTVGQLNVTFLRKTQKQENDLAFLRRIANQYNYAFTIKGSQMVFTARSALEQQAPSWLVARQNETKFSFKDKSHGTYQAAQVNYFDPHTKNLITATAASTVPNATGDTLKIRDRVENGQDAQAKAAAAIHKANMTSVTAAITTVGSTLLAAGSTGNLAGWGEFDGTYLIETAKHKLTRANGYQTELELRKVG